VCRDGRILAPDFSGHGARTAEAGAFGIPQFAGDLVSFLDAEGITQADIFGYSMGGYVALHAARQHPARIGSIMTLGTKFAWDPPTAEKEAARLDPAAIESKVPAFASRLKELHGDRWVDVVRRTAGMMLELGASPALRDGDFGSIPHRALLGVGSADEMVTLEETANTVRLLPSGGLLVIPGMRHPIERADPNLLAGKIAGFFSGEGTPVADRTHRIQSNIEQTP